LEGHEQPYLRGGAYDVIRTGHTFSNEPGVYIEGKLAYGSKTVFISLKMGLGYTLHRMWVDRAIHPGNPER